MKHSLVCLSQFHTPESLEEIARRALLKAFSTKGYIIEPIVRLIRARKSTTTFQEMATFPTFDQFTEGYEQRVFFEWHNLWNSAVVVITLTTESMQRPDLSDFTLSSVVAWFWKGAEVQFVEFELQSQ